MSGTTERSSMTQFISDDHAHRALGYLGVSLAERGDLAADFEQPLLLDLWDEALAATVDETFVPMREKVKRFVEAYNQVFRGA